MRRVEVYDYDYVKRPMLPGGKHHKKLVGQGWFHAFGLDWEEVGDSAPNHSVAIVELDDGSCLVRHPELIRFLDDPLCDPEGGAGK